MQRIYEFLSSSRYHSSFTEYMKEDTPYRNGSQLGIGYASMEQNWQPYGDEYVIPKLTLVGSDDGRKNYKFDMSSGSSPFYVFSERAVDVLGDILRPRGQFLEVETESRRKKFIGYYPTNALKGCLDMDKSNYEQYEKGLMIRKYVLISKNITDEYLFSLEEGVSVFVTEKFRHLVEKHKLEGFNFGRDSREIELT